MQKIWLPLITPFTDGALDEAGLAALKASLSALVDQLVPPAAPEPGAA